MENSNEVPPSGPLIRRPIQVVRGFSEFIREYGVMPLAIGVVMGSAVNDLVKSLVDGLITPLISLFTPDSMLQGLQLEYHGSVFKIGSVLNSTLTFISVGAVVYLTVKLILRNDALLKKK
jgi:large conductance mechanosensitive channel